MYRTLSKESGKECGVVNVAKLGLIWGEANGALSQPLAYSRGVAPRGFPAACLEDHY